MATKAELYLLLLQDLEKSVADIMGTAIVTPDGLIISSTASDGIDRETFSAYSAATFKHAGRAMEEISDEKIDMLLFESKNYRVITARATEYALLITLTSKNAQLGMVLFEMQRISQKIKEI